MSTYSAHQIAAHVPLIPSPLNPRSQDEAVLEMRRRQRRRTCGAMRRNTGMSPAQRLLRYKAAEAWRSLAMREVERLEKNAAAAEDVPVRQVFSSLVPPPMAGGRHGLTNTYRQMRTVMLRPEKTTASGRKSGRHEPETTGTEADDDDDDDEGKEEKEAEQSQFQVPTLGFFALRQVVLSAGMRHMQPLLRVKS
ncbi:hypothetical protein DCS_00507 [Drechmeria coniospora]|uniref:Uncharacterized protein n=1 Tax=Drechmeria coniospora TaxID=98403 RepID=A0A151GQI8_DRECN|nr:hypothetical protein DCS_00507 [Drechmeria coniospora]KYK59377.1 hypothetical protein DCS_00507 [Drechmeria coniospora]ODA76376.1 hypothetical protein RJ55_08222 [Drechmeria coniospora]